MRPHITRVKSNIKGRGTADLGEKTLILGPTGSGKSSIVEAAQLALTGGVFGILLRNKTVKQADQLRELGSPGTPLFSRATLSTGGIAQWSLDPRKKAHQTGPSAIAVTVAEVRAAFSGSADRALFFLHERLISERTKEDLLNEFEDNRVLHGAFSHLLFNRQDGDEVSLVALQAEAAKRSRDEKKEGEFFKKVADLTGESAHQDKGLKHLRHAQGWADVSKQITGLIRDEIQAPIGPQGSNSGCRIDALESYASAFLPGEEELKIDLKKGRVGMRFDEGAPPVFTLSGSQEARALVVFASAIIALDAKTKHGVALLIVEDRMWDPAQLASMMRALTESNAQILITSTIKPKGKMPKGWTLINVEG